MSSTKLHHLAGVGHLLGSVIQSPLSQWSFLQVRNVLLAMADLLFGLESALSFTPGIALKLKSHVSRIDHYMTAAAVELSQRNQIFHSALPREAWSNESHVALSSAIPANVNTDPAPTNTEAVMNNGFISPFDLSPDDQFQLPNDLFVDWPFAIGQGEAFDFLGDYQTAGTMMDDHLGNGGNRMEGRPD